MDKNTVRKVTSYIISRLQETSTVRGVLVVSFMIFGVVVDKALLPDFTACALLLSGVMKVLLPDNLK